MKIDPYSKSIPLPPVADKRTERSDASASPASGDAAATSISLSARASQIQDLQAQLATVPVVDRARVETIKQAISSGQYSVNPDNIASGLIDSVKEMLHVAK
jgi:negative regulator of flagellin synthesis FlgM